MKRKFLSVLFSAVFLFASINSVHSMKYIFGDGIPEHIKKFGANIVKEVDEELDREMIMLLVLDPLKYDIYLGIPPSYSPDKVRHKQIISKRHSFSIKEKRERDFEFQACQRLLKKIVSEMEEVKRTIKDPNAWNKQSDFLGITIVLPEVMTLEKKRDYLEWKKEDMFRFFRMDRYYVLQDITRRLRPRILEVKKFGQMCDVIKKVNFNRDDLKRVQERKQTIESEVLQSEEWKEYDEWFEKRKELFDRRKQLREEEEEFVSNDIDSLASQLEEMLVIRNHQK